MKPAARPPLQKFRLPQRAWLFDLDGTIYRGEALIPGADTLVAALRRDGRRVVFLSNKPLATRATSPRSIRIETDILMGRRGGLATVLVLSGITGADDPRIAEIAPDLVLPSVGDLMV